MKYVIIGNSATACGAVEGIRTKDTTGEIIIVSDENHHVYSRPLISYLLSGKTDEQRMKYRPDDFYIKNNVKTILGKRVTSIDTSSGSITLDSGEKISYEKLLIATGSRPFIPTMNGLDNVKQKFCFTTLDEANALDNALFPDARVLIIGGGLIGLKCAEGIAAKVGKITVIDLAPQILSSILDNVGASAVQKHLEAQGIDFMLNTSVDKFSGNLAKLKTGEKLEFDILVTAVGVLPNTELVKVAGGEVKRGIVVNEYMQTSLDNIYAAGDCVESFDLSSGQNRILAILPNAYSGGMAAGIAMVNGTTSPQKSIPMNAIGFFGMHIITAGTYEGEIFETKSENTYKKLFYSNNKLNGFILIEDVDRAGIYTSLIREQTPLSSIDFKFICERPSLLAFSRSYRDKNLGGKLSEVNCMIIDCTNKKFDKLNSEITSGENKVILENCCGQRFIGAGLEDISITVNGIPGNALGAYLNGAKIVVNGNAQDATGDTMNDGIIEIHGSCGDAVGYAMRGGEIYIRYDVGYRAGIHMKAFEKKSPVLVIGGRAGSFLGEYQAGGLIIALGLSCEDEKVVNNFCGTGMHGGKIIIRTEKLHTKISPQVSIKRASDEDLLEIAPYISKFCKQFNFSENEVYTKPFYTLTPNSSNPYKQLYVQN